MADMGLLSAIAGILQGQQPQPAVRPAAQGGSIGVPVPRPNPVRVQPRMTGVEAERARNGAPPLSRQGQDMQGSIAPPVENLELKRGEGGRLLSGVKIPTLSGETDLGSAFRSFAAGVGNVDPNANDLQQAASAFLGSSGYADQRRQAMAEQERQSTAAAQLNAAIDGMADLTPEQKLAAKADPSIAVAIIKSRLGKDEAVTPLITNFRFAQQNGFKGSFQDWISTEKAKEAGGAEYGLTPVYGKDADGNIVIGQLAKDGTFRQTQLPDGFKPAPGVQKIDLGTAWGILDRDGNVVSTIPKDISGEEQAKTTGKAAGEAAMQIPAMRSTAAMISEQISSLKNDPYLPRMLGPVDSRLPNATTDAARVQAKLDQLQGGAFLQARQMLKGGGAITDYEGQKAESAFARLNTAQSEEDFKQALDDFDSAVQEGIRKLEAQAGTAQTEGNSAPSVPAAAPATTKDQTAPDPLGIR